MEAIALPTYLVVDDSRTSRLTMAAAVRQATEGAEVVEAEDANQALAAFRKRPFDVVFLDMMLDDRAGNGTGGLGLLKDILEAKPDARIVLVTALPGDHPDVISAVSHGAFSHISKPLRADTIRRVLREVESEHSGHGRIR